jgi:ribulose-5-phosphate 4-epimerase/fuculose-1-phosphate aldolase
VKESTRPNGEYASTSLPAIGWQAHFRLTGLDLHAHFRASAAETNEKHFLINAYGQLFEEVTASSLGEGHSRRRHYRRRNRGLGINPAGYVIHSAIPRRAP